MDDCSGSKRVRGIDDYFVRFSHAAQDLGLDAKVSSDLDVTELHNAFGVHHANLQIFSAKDEGVVR